MRIGFYLQNRNISQIDCSQPLVGNPGIGGTEYLLYAIPFSLVAYGGSNHEIVLLANSTERLPGNIETVQTEDANIKDVVKSLNLDLLVIRYSFDNLILCKSIDDTTGVVMWAHNFIRRSELTLLAKNEKVKAVVCVGSEQLNIYRDHEAFKKSVVIYNAYPIEHFILHESSKVCRFDVRRNEVTYLGNLVDFKGFHLLAAAWKNIIKEVPDAHLNVIGGGKLYDRNQKLGRWGIAEENYEKLFMQHLVDENGNIIPSVTFHGVMGAEKSDILNITKVGIPNPSGVSETFCIAALELQLWGACVTTINYGGFKDTVFSSGILYDNISELASTVVKMLKKEDNDYDTFLTFAGKFDFKKIVKDWNILFDSIANRICLYNLLKPELSSSDAVTEMNRKVKSWLPFGKYLPTVMAYKSIVNRIKSMISL